MGQQIVSGECFTLLSAGSIHEYMTASNRLAEIAGASELVRDTLEEWRQPRAFSPHAEVIYIGGGNAALKFPNKSTALSAIRDWSLQWLKKAPHLRLVAAHRDIGDQDQQFDYLDVLDDLERNNERAPFNAEMGALPVVRACQSTGKGACCQYSGNGESAWLSAESAAKRGYAKKAYERITREYESLPGNCVFPKEFENLGTAKDASQIAIVYADGNGIGKLFRQTAEQAENAGKMMDDLESLSKAVQEIGRGAFHAAIGKLQNQWEALIKKRVINIVQSRHKKYYFPLRPLIDGGDDLCFVCHGKLGLRLAVDYLESFVAKSRGQGKDWTACAGVLIMPQKFPFARGFHLADELCKSAKTKSRDYGGNDCWIDFHVVLEGTGGSVRALREGRVRSARPYRLTQGVEEGSWGRFESLWRQFSDPEKWPRSRAKRYLEALAGGDSSVQQLEGLYRSAGILLPLKLSDQTSESYRAELWDALEMLDFHMEWPKQK